MDFGYTSSVGCTRRRRRSSNVGMAATKVPSFLSKTYDLVDDASTVAVVSWGRSGDSFVVWNPLDFSTDLLPKFFKHSNFSSFVRQLNNYVRTYVRNMGFKKVDPDRWEFANRWFVRGRRDLLRGISRRRKPTGITGRKLGGCSKNDDRSDAAGCVEERELILHLRQQQQDAGDHLHDIGHRIHCMEQRQQKMLSFLSAALQNRSLLPDLSHACGGTSRKRKPVMEEDLSSSESLEPLLEEEGDDDDDDDGMAMGFINGE